MTNALPSSRGVIARFQTPDPFRTAAASDMEADTPSALVLRKLAAFFEVQANFDTLELLLDKQKGRAAQMPSLRVLEHLVTGFSRRQGFDFRLPHRDVPMHLYDAYQAELLRHGKVLFDVFAREDRHCRAKHVLQSPDGDGRSLKTTPKQMNFVRWAILNEVIDYAKRHLAEIRDHLPQQSRHRTAPAPVESDNPKKPRTSFQCPSKIHGGDFRLSFQLPTD
ncbi:hypothetical protein WJX74_001165 [Apatococcus lobatus]|uniref:Uncharacterized protein n=1 Tax=Apatococcus lobatus TaxID=904363 RepID=A0AAW1Q718_9CHLO